MNVKQAIINLCQGCPRHCMTALPCINLALPLSHCDDKNTTKNNIFIF